MSPVSSTHSAFVTAVNAERAYLLRLARLQLSEPGQAENVVEQTLATAREMADGLAGAPSVRAWVTGQLKSRIIEALRNASPGSAARLPGEEAVIDDLDVFFSAGRRDQWATKPAEWRNPERDLEQREFIDALERCLESLPPHTARAFLLREAMELEPDEICRTLRITATDLWVLLYRARMSLRQCLEHKWFACVDDSD